MFKKPLLALLIFIAIIIFGSTAYSAWSIISFLSGSASGEFQSYSIRNVNDFVDLNTAHYDEDAIETIYYLPNGFTQNNSTSSTTHLEQYSYFKIDTTDFINSDYLHIIFSIYDISDTFISDNDCFLTAYLYDQNKDPIGNINGIVSIDTSITVTINHNLGESFYVAIKLTLNTNDYSTWYNKLDQNLVDIGLHATINSDNTKESWLINFTANISYDTSTIVNLSWNYVAPFTYDKTEHVVSLTQHSGVNITYTDNLKMNAGNYQAIAEMEYSKKYIVYVDGVLVGNGSSCNLSWIINKRDINISYTDLDYDATKRTWDLIKNEIASNCELLNVISGDNLTININGMHNGYFAYGTNNNSNNLVGSTYNGKTLAADNNGVVGSTYLVYASLSGISSINYNLTNPTFILKYKTALLSSANSTNYYTIEDAIAGNGNIYLAGNLANISSYVYTSFSALSNLDNPYSSYYDNYDNTFKYNLSKNIYVCYDNSGQLLNTLTSDTTGNVYSALYIPSNVQVAFLNSYSLNICATIGHNMNVTTSRVGNRGVVINDGKLLFENGSTLYSYGFLLGDGIINLMNGSKAYDVLSAYDFPGGNASNKMYENVFPINAYSLHNISCKTYIYSGSQYYAYMYVHLSSIGGTYKGEANALLIGKPTDNNCLFKPTAVNNNNYIEKSATNIVKEVNTNLQRANTSDTSFKNRKDIIKIHGSYSDASFSMTISVIFINVGFSTNLNKPLPIGYMNIELVSGGNLTLTNSDYLFLPGSYLKVDPGATLTIGNGTSGNSVDLSFVEINSYGVSSGANSKPRYFSNYASSTDKAYLENNGTVIINSYSKIGGFIKTCSNTGDASIIIPSNGNVADYRIMCSTDDPWYRTSTISANSYIREASGLSNSPKLLGQGTYLSYKDGDNYGWLSNSVIISFDSNGGSSVADVGPYTITSNGYTITSLDLSSIPIKNHYIFDGWYIDRELTTLALDEVIYISTTLYAKWIPSTYSINYIFNQLYDNTYTDGTETNNINNPIYYSIEDNVIIYPPIYGDYVFDGWYTDSNYTNQISSFNGLNIINSLGLTAPYTLTLYGIWYPQNTATYTITYVNPNTDEGCTCVASQNVLSVNIPSYVAPDLTGKNLDKTYGKYFEGWYLDSSFNTKYTSYTQITGDCSLYARWLNKNKVIASYLIFNNTWYVNKDQAINLPDVTAYGISITEGYDFVWDITEGIYDGLSIPNGAQNIVFSDTWDLEIIAIGREEIKKFTVTFVAGDNGSVSPTSISNVPYGSIISISSNEITINGTTVTATANEKYKFKKWNGIPSNNQVNSNITITAEFESDGGCLDGNTIIELYDGSLKAIRDINLYDLVKTYNFYTGEIEYKPVILIDKVDYSYNHVIVITLSNGIIMEAIYHQTFFDFDNKCFFEISMNNYMDYIGTNVLLSGLGGLEKSTIVNIELKIKYTDAYELITMDNYNYFADGCLTIAPRSVFNIMIFELTDEFTYDNEQMAIDIDIYGLYTYEEWSEYVTLEEFYLLNGPYFKIAVGKGLITVQEIIEELLVFKNDLNLIKIE